MSLQSRKVGAKSSKKQDIEQTANKLRAIKERQGHWMREREQAKAITSSKSVESLSSRSKTKSTRSSSISELSSNAESRSGSSRDLYSNPRRKPLYTPPKRDHSNVISWSAPKGESLGNLGRPPSGQRKHPPASKVSNVNSDYSNSKIQKAKEKTYVASNYSSSNNYPSNEFDGLGLGNKLQNSSFHSESENFEKDEERYDMKADNHNNKPNKFHDMEERPSYESGISKNMSPDVIDALAETVARKLKTRNNSGNNARHFRDAADNQEDEQDMATHMCSLCRSLMSGSRHTPMALIPCGHTLCKECTSECTKCPTCQSRVKSSAVNTVLQQIISDVLAQKEKKRLEKLEQETRKYVDEYQSLSLRSNALAEEADCILNGMEELTEKLFQEKKVHKRLEVDNDELTKKISELQNQLDRNKVKMMDSRERCEHLESDYETEKQRLSMVEDTIKTISQSKERVKMMVQNFAPSFNLAQFD